MLFSEKEQEEIAKAEITLTKSQKGGTLINLSGYKFYKNKKNGDKIYWNCSTHYKLGCRAVIHTLEDFTIIKSSNIHNH